MNVATGPSAHQVLAKLSLGLQVVPGTDAHIHTSRVAPAELHVPVVTPVAELEEPTDGVQTPAIVVVGFTALNSVLPLDFKFPLSVEFVLAAHL